MHVRMTCGNRWVTKFVLGSYGAADIKVSATFEKQLDQEVLLRLCA